MQTWYIMSNGGCQLAPSAVTTHANLARSGSTLRKQLNEMINQVSY